MTGSQHSLGRRVAVGAAFMVAQRAVARTIGLLSTVILVRLLAPEDFGLVGFLTVSYSFLEGAAELSTSLALLRMQAPEQKHYDTAWTIGILRAGALAGCFAILAPFLADYINDSRAQAICYVLAAIATLQGLENIGWVKIQRELRFDRIFRLGLMTKLTGFCVTLPAAFAFHNYWALIAGICATRLASVVLGYVLLSYRPRLSLSAWREFFHFSKWMTVINLQTLIDQYSLMFVISRLSGAQGVGFYQVAYQVAALPISEIAAPARDPIYAGYSRVRNEVIVLRQQFLDGFALIFALTVPACIGIALLAQPIAILFLGWKWMPVVPLIGLCALYALFDSIGHFTQPLFTVLDRQRTFSNVLSLVLMIRIPSLIVGGYFYGVQGAAFAMMVTAALNCVLWVSKISPIIGVFLADYLRVTWRTIAGTVAMAAVVWWLSQKWAVPVDVGANLLRTLTLSTAGACTQFVVQYLLWVAVGLPAGAESTILRFAGAVLEKVSLFVRRRSERPT